MVTESVRIFLATDLAYSWALADSNCFLEVKPIAYFFVMFVFVPHIPDWVMNIDNFCTTALIFMLTLAVWLRLLTHGSLKSYESKYINLYWTKSHQHPRLCNALSLQNNLKVWSSTPSLFLPRKQCNNLYCIIKKTNNLVYSF